MRVSGHAVDVFTAGEIETIHQSALRILEEMGMEIQNRSLLEDLAATGFPVDFVQQRVRFPKAQVERFIAQAEKYDWSTATPTLTVTAGVYQSQLLHPETSTLEEWTEETLAFYFALARALPNVDHAEMLGCRIPVPDGLEPLYERYFCWKYGALEGSSIYEEAICPYLYEIYAAWAAQQKKDIQEVFREPYTWFHP